VGTLDVYSTRPRAWTAHELEALGEFAAVAGKLVHTSVELAQLRQALTRRVWIEQAKGVLAATHGTDPEAAFQQLRIRARSSSRKLAEVAQEVVQDAQRERLADLARRRADLDQIQVVAEERDRIADQRNHAADKRDRVADERERAADDRDRLADERDRRAGHPDPA